MFEKMIKKLDFWDIAFTKIAVMAFVLSMVSLFPSFTSWVQSINPIYFIILFILFAIKPLCVWFKK
jgi:hypothetical protein